MGWFSPPPPAPPPEVVAQVYLRSGERYAITRPAGLPPLPAAERQGREDALKAMAEAQPGTLALPPGWGYERTPPPHGRLSDDVLPPPAPTA